MWVVVPEDRYWYLEVGWSIDGQSVDSEGEIDWFKEAIWIVNLSIDLLATNEEMF